MNKWVIVQVDMITEMDNLVNPGSDLLIAAALPEAEMQRRLYAGGIMTSPCVRNGCFACKGKLVGVASFTTDDVKFSLKQGRKHAKTEEYSYEIRKRRMYFTKALLVT